MHRAALLAMCALLSQSGCSAVAASFASHNSRGTSCMDEPALPAIDLIAGSLGALALVYTGTSDESPGWLIIPGVFMLSGVIASITVYSCRHPSPSESTGVGQRAPQYPPNNVIPQEVPEEESDVRDATPEELGIKTPVYIPPPAVDPNTVKPPVTKEPDPKPTECRINPLTSCPDGWSCVLTAGDHGFCRRDSEFSQPKITPP